MSPADNAGNNHDAEVERAVLAYLGRHPLAADTLDGITRWWLPQQRYVTAQSRVEAVLSRLVSQGVLQMRPLSTGIALYALEEQRRRSSLLD